MKNLIAVTFVLATITSPTYAHRGHGDTFEVRRESVNKTQSIRNKVKRGLATKQSCLESVRSAAKESGMKIESVPVQIGLNL